MAEKEVYDLNMVSRYTLIIQEYEFWTIDVGLQKYYSFLGGKEVGTGSAAVGFAGWFADKDAIFVREAVSRAATTITTSDQILSLGGKMVPWVSKGAGILGAFAAGYSFGTCIAQSGDGTQWWSNPPETKLSKEKQWEIVAGFYTEELPEPMFVSYGAGWRGFPTKKGYDGKVARLPRYWLPEAMPLNEEW